MAKRPRAACTAAAALGALLLWPASAAATLRPLSQYREVGNQFLFVPPCFGYFDLFVSAPDFGPFDETYSESMTCPGVGTSSAFATDTSSFRANGFDATGSGNDLYAGGPAVGFDALGHISFEVTGLYAFTLAGTLDFTGSLELAEVRFSAPGWAGRADTPGPFFFSGFVGSSSGDPEVFSLDYLLIKEVAAESVSGSYDLALTFTPVAALPAASVGGRASMAVLMLGSGLLVLAARRNRGA